MTGTQISNMDPSPAIPDGAVVPFVVPPLTPGFDSGLNYIYGLGADLMTRVSYPVLALATGASLVGIDGGGSVQTHIDDLASPTGGEMVGNELPDGADLRNQLYTEFVASGVLQPSQFSGTPEQQLVRAITEANQSRNGGLGQTVQLPRGEIEVSASFNTGNRASLIGVNKRGSRIKAASGHSGPSMVTVLNGTTSTFDNALERLTLDCNDVAGLSGIIADAWQEGGGLHKVLVQKFRDVGVLIRTGYGGAAMCLIDECEIFGSGVSAATCGIKMEEVSAISNFMVNVTNCTITGSPGMPMTRGIEVENDSLFCRVVHFEEVDTGIYLDGGGHHVLIGVTGSQTGGGVPTVTNLVEIAATFTGSVSMRGCFRGGALNFLKDNRVGGFGTISGYDIPRLDISSRPPLSLGAVVASASINGGGGGATVTSGFGIASVVANSTGDYTVTISDIGKSADDFTIVASTNEGAGNVRCDIAGTGIFRIRTFAADGVTPVNVSELKIIVVRVK